MSTHLTCMQNRMEIKISGSGELETGDMQIEKNLAVRMSGSGRHGISDC